MTHPGACAGITISTRKCSVSIYKTKTLNIYSYAIQIRKLVAIYSLKKCVHKYTDLKKKVYNKYL